MDVFTRFKQAIKIREVLLDNEVFQLHYRVTAILLLACAGLVASKQHFGDPIDCITRDDVPNKIMDTYCWIHSTFTLPDACNKTVGLEVAHPCVDKSDTNNKEERIYHKYYQWVYFVLFFQACGFYAPHLVWKAWEAKLLRNLTVDLDLRSPLASDENEKRTAIRRIVRYFVRNEQSRNNRHQNYFRYFTLCEAMNFLNVIVQIYLVDEFLGGTFTTYGLDVLDYAQLDQEDRVDPMVRVFPRMTKCTFHRFGSSGDVQRHDALCILPLNIINEKIYIVMWFWFVFLALITGAWLVYRTFTIFKPSIRYKVLRRRASLANKTSMKDLVESVLDTGDWFLLSMMCKNMDSQWFKYLIENLAKQMTKSKRDKLMHNRLGKDRRPNYGRNNDETQSNIELQEADNLVPDDAGQSGSESDAGPADNLEEVAVKS